MAKVFDKKAFDVQFDKAIETLTESEKVTKAVFRDLSRSSLEALFVTEDIAYVNRVIHALTPVNKKVAIEYYKALTGFSFSQEHGAFGKKDKKRFEAKKKEALEFLADPHNNIWTWAEVNIDLQPKQFDINQIGKYFTSALKRAEKNGYSDVDVIAQVFASGIDVDAIYKAMEKLVPVEKQVMIVDGIVPDSDA